MKGSSESIRDYAENHFPDPNQQRSFYITEQHRSATPVPLIDLNRKSYWELNETKIEDYNNNLTTLDEQYSSILPLSSVIVRMYHIVPEKTKAGLIIEPKISMKEVTQNGIGVRQTMESPWPFTRKGVVVAKPTYDCGFQVGDVVQVTQDSIMAIKPSVDHPPHLEYGYTNTDWLDFEPPTSPDNPHFGYLQLNPTRQIVAVLSNAKPLTVKDKE